MFLARSKAPGQAVAPGSSRVVHPLASRLIRALRAFAPRRRLALALLASGMRALRAKDASPFYALALALALRRILALRAFASRSGHADDNSLLRRILALRAFASRSDALALALALAPALALCAAHADAGVLVPVLVVPVVWPGVVPCPRVRASWCWCSPCSSSFGGAPAG